MLPLRITEVNSNIVFIFPIITSYTIGDMVYCFLSIIIFIASGWYHFYKENNPSGVYINKLRILDRCVAIASYLYLFYFAYTFLLGAKYVFYGLLVITIISYFFGKQELGKKYNIHSHFHIAIGLVAGLMPLFYSW